MVIAYNMNWLSCKIVQRKKLQPWVGLPDILCELCSARVFAGPQLAEALAEAVFTMGDAKL
jgi:lipid-A-disaccharide synthase